MIGRAAAAQEALNAFSQKQVDAICAAIAAAGFAAAEATAKLAVEETGMGRVESKRLKNTLCTRDLWATIKDWKTVGVIARDEARRVYEIAEPMGVVAAVIPTTNPTSTAFFKILIALKSRNAIVISPHPRAAKCVSECARIAHEAGLKAGMPDGAINCMRTVTLEGTTELMRNKKTGVILATGGEQLVTAAYSSGKPAFGVGPGNVPAYIERTADVRHAVTCIVDSMMFDYGTVCASEQAVIVDAPIRDEVVAEFKRQKAHFVSPDEKKLMDPVIIKGSLMNPECVGKSAAWIAKRCGFAVPDDTTVLLAELKTVGREEPLSREKLMPVLAFYTEPDWKTACERAIEVLRFGGMGHTMVVHSRDEKVVMEFALKKPAYRFLVNTPSTMGSVGITTHLVPSMTLGCGTPGGNITSDNINPMNLLNIKRLAFDREDPWSQTMKVSEAIVSDFTPFEKPEAPAAPKPVAARSAVPEGVLVYNGRPRDIRTL